MPARLFEAGRSGLIDGTVDIDTNTIKIALLDLGTPDTGIKAIASSTNATPIVVTATAHGFANGDIVVIGGHATNTAANGVWRIANVAANTFELTDPVSGANAVGNGVGGATGYAVCLGPSAAGDNWDDFDAAVVGTPQTLTSPTVTAGVFDSADPTFTAVTGASVEAFVQYKDTGTASTSRMVFFNDGRHIVTCAAQAAASATTIAVERLTAGIPNGTVLAFSNGASATLSALANAGDRTLTVSALAAIITAGSRADAPMTGAGLPVTPNGGNIAITAPNTGPWPGAGPGWWQV
jgi:ribosomal protein S11